MAQAPERRIATRIDKVFRVLISSEETGDQWYIARNISERGMFVEMAEPLPLKTKVIVRFRLPRDTSSICAVAHVQHQYYFQYADGGGIRGLAGVGVRFQRFYPEAGRSLTPERPH